MKLRKHLAALLAALLAAAPVAHANEMSNSTWSETDNSNNSAAPNGWTPGTMTPNQVEPTAQAMMGGLKRWWDRDNPVNSTAGTAPHYTLSLANASFPAAYVQGEKFCAKADKTSVGADDFAINALAAKPIYVVGAATGASNAAPQLVPIGGGDILQNAMFCVVYDGALNGGNGGFQLLATPQKPGDALLYSGNFGSAQSTVNISLPPGYAWYELVVNNFRPVANGTYAWLRVDNSSYACASVTTTGYVWQMPTFGVFQWGGTAQGFGGGNASVMQTSYTVGNTAGSTMMERISIYPGSPGASADTQISFQASGFDPTATWWTATGMGAASQAGVKCVQFGAGGAGSTWTGQLLLYGHRQ